MQNGGSIRHLLGNCRQGAWVLQARQKGRCTHSDAAAAVSRRRRQCPPLAVVPTSVSSCRALRRCACAAPQKARNSASTTDSERQPAICCCLGRCLLLAVIVESLTTASACVVRRGLTGSAELAAAELQREQRPVDGPCINPCMQTSGDKLTLRPRAFKLGARPEARLAVPHR